MDKVRGLQAAWLVEMASYNLDGVSQINAIYIARMASMQCFCRRGFCLRSGSAGSVVVAVVVHVAGAGHKGRLVLYVMRRLVHLRGVRMPSSTSRLRSRAAVRREHLAMRL